MQNLVWGTFFTKVSKMVVKIWPDLQLIYEWVNFIMENWNEPWGNFIFTVACPYHKHCSEEPLQYKPCLLSIISQLLPFCLNQAL